MRSTELIPREFMKLQLFKYEKFKNYFLRKIALQVDE